MSDEGSSAGAPSVSAGRSHRFEDLPARRKARERTRLTYDVTRNAAFRAGRARAVLVQRAVASSMFNIAEGYERGSRREFHNVLLSAKASGADVRSQMYVARDAGYLPPDDFHPLLTRTEEVDRVVGGLRASVERKIQHG